jgi:hypothetical protein
VYPAAVAELQFIVHGVWQYVGDGDSMPALDYIDMTVSGTCVFQLSPN